MPWTGRPRPASQHRIPDRPDRAKLDFDVSDGLTMVVGAVILGARSRGAQERALRDNADLTRPAPGPGST